MGKFKSRTRNVKSFLISRFIFLNGIISIVILGLILAFLIANSIRFFSTYPFFEFLTGQKWSPTVLKDFGFGDLELTVYDFTVDDNIIQLGVEPLRIDLMTSISGLEFDQAYARKIEADYFGMKTSIISLSDILKNKRSSGRKKDRDDLKWIEKYSKK